MRDCIAVAKEIEEAKKQIIAERGKMTIGEAKQEAHKKAFDSLARYKFMMFGYHAALWVTLNRLDTHKEPNPFASLVNLARETKD